MSLSKPLIFLFCLSLLISALIIPYLPSVYASNILTTTYIDLTGAPSYTVDSNNQPFVYNNKECKSINLTTIPSIYTAISNPNYSSSTGQFNVTVTNITSSQKIEYTYTETLQTGLASLNYLDCFTFQTSTNYHIVLFVQFSSITYIIRINNDLNGNLIGSLQRYQTQPAGNTVRIIDSDTSTPTFVVYWGSNILNYCPVNTSGSPPSCTQLSNTINTQPRWAYNHLFVISSGSITIIGSRGGTTSSNIGTTITHSTMNSQTALAIDHKYYYYTSSGNYYRVNWDASPYTVEQLPPLRSDYNIFTNYFPFSYTISGASTIKAPNGYDLSSGFYYLADKQQWNDLKLRFNHIIYTNNNFYEKQADWVLRRIQSHTYNTNSYTLNQSNTGSSLLRLSNPINWQSNVFGFKHPVSSGVNFYDRVNNVTDDQTSHNFKVITQKAIEMTFNQSSIQQQWVLDSRVSKIYWYPFTTTRNQPTTFNINPAQPNHMVMVIRDGQGYAILGQIIPLNTSSVTIDLTANTCYLIDFYSYDTWAFIKRDAICTSQTTWTIDFTSFNVQINSYSHETYQFQPISNTQIQITKIDPSTNITRTIKITDFNNNLLLNQVTTFTNSPITLTVSNTDTKVVNILDGNTLKARYMWTPITSTPFLGSFIQQWNTWLGSLNLFLIWIVLIISVWSRSTYNIIPALILLMIWIGSYYGAFPSIDNTPILTVFIIGILVFILVKRYG